MPPATVDQLSQNNIDAIEKHLAFLYGSEKAPTLKEQVLAIISQHLSQRMERDNRPIWDETDTLLITYGDSLQKTGEAPLQTLDDFANQRLRQAFNLIHLLPMFPYSSDDGFSVINYQKIDEKLGDWNDIERINQHFDLMIDFVLNHCSRYSLWFNDFLLDVAPGGQRLAKWVFI